MSHAFTINLSVIASTVDMQALIRAIVVSGAVGLIIGAVTFFATRERAEWKRWRVVIFMGIIGIALLAGLITYTARPSLINVPSLDGLSQAQAEDLLRQNELIPQARPQYSDSANAGRVIAHSQSHAPGLSVKPGTVVAFAVGEGREGGETTPPVNPTPNPMSVSLFKPKSGETISLIHGPSGIYRLSAQGTSFGLDDRYGLLLWVRPVNPPAEGWYLQTPPKNGVTSIDASGTWTGVAQIGNAQYSPHQGDTLDLAITITTKSDIDKLMAEQGEVVRNEPVGVKTAKASGIAVTLK